MSNPCMTELERSSYEALYAKTVAWMKQNTFSVLQEGKPYPQPTYGKVDLSSRLKEWLSRSTVTGIDFSGNLPDLMGLSTGRIDWPLALKTLHVDRQTWATRDAKRKFNVTVGYFGAVGLYPNCRSTDDGESEAFATVWDWSESGNPRLEAHYLASGAGKYRFCFDGRKLCEVTWSKGVTPRSIVVFKASSSLEPVSVNYNYGFKPPDVGLIAAGAVLVALLIYKHQRERAAK